MWFGFLMILVVGCGPEEMPKGTGASGTLTQAAQSADIGLALINKLNPEQEKALQWLHQPFDQVATPTSDLSKEQSDQLEEIKNHWDEVKFAEPISDPAKDINGRKYDYAAVFVTEFGNIEIQFLGDYVPQLVRTFIIMANHGMFDGKKLYAKDGVMWIGSPDERPLFHTSTADYVTNFRQGVLFVPNEGDKAEATRFAITLSEQPALTGKATGFGGTVPSTDMEAFGKLKAAVEKESGSVELKRVQIVSRTVPLFQTAGQVNLPRLGENGRPPRPLDPAQQGTQNLPTPE